MGLGDEKFTGVNSINDYLFISNIENNLKSFLDWGFLNIGGFINVTDTPNNQSNAPNRLAAVNDPNYSDGQVWQTIHKDWIYDSPTDYSPLFITGLSVDGNPISTGYVLDYANSRVVFDAPIPTYSDVRMDYAYRWVQVHKSSSNLVWWKQFQFDVVNDATQFHQNTGEYAIFNQHRIQLPSVIIETVPSGTSRPYRLGDKSLVSKQDIILHVIANTPAHRNSIIDIIRLQEDKVIWLYDTNKLILGDVLPFNFDGSLNSNYLQYNMLVNNCDEFGVCDETYRWKRCHLQNFNVSSVESRYYFEEAKIRITAEIIFDDIG